MFVRILLTSLFYQTTYSSTPYGLIQHLTSKSSPRARPVKNKKTSVVVTLGFTLNQILSLDEQEQHVTTKIWLRMKWVNEFLTWNATEWGDVRDVRMTQNDVWTPDIFLNDDVSDDVSQGPFGYKTHVNVYSTGQQLWMIPVKLQTSCHIDVAEFPFDHQECSLVFLSWTHNQNEIDMIKEDKPVVTPYYLNSSEWTLHNLEVIRHSKMYDCCPDPFVSMEFKFTLLRIPFYHLYVLVLPCVIQMILMLSTFYLPLESGERIGVIITILLVFAVYLEVLSNSLPKVSSSTPLLSRFFIITMIESAFLLISTFLIMNVHFKGSKSDSKRVPLWLKRLFLDPHKTEISIPCNAITDSDDESSIDDANENYLKEINPGVDPITEEVRTITKLISKMNKHDEIEGEWQKLARALNRACFYFFLILFVSSSLTIMLPSYYSHTSVTHSGSKN